jgi:hypothetical protein
LRRVVVRLIPPATPGEARYRVIGCLRDERPEWTMHRTGLGLVVAQGETVFVTDAVGP